MDMTNSFHQYRWEFDEMNLDQQIFSIKVVHPRIVIRRRCVLAVCIHEELWEDSHDKGECMEQ